MVMAGLSEKPSAFAVTRRVNVGHSTVNVGVNV
jgi:hypothetical protein